MLNLNDSLKLFFLYIFISVPDFDHVTTGLICLLVLQLSDGLEGWSGFEI